MTALSGLLYLVFSLCTSQRLQLHDIKAKIQHNPNREDVRHSKKAKFSPWPCQINQAKRQSCSDANGNSESNNSYHDAGGGDIESSPYFKPQVELVYDAWFIPSNPKFPIRLDPLFAQIPYSLKFLVRPDPLFAQILCSPRSPVSSDPLFAQIPWSLRSPVSSNSLFAKIPCSLRFPVPSNSLFAQISCSSKRFKF